MIVKKEKRTNAGSCNFCDKGVMSRSRNSLIYSYDEVFTMRSERSGGGLKASICEECVEELAAKVALEKL